MHIGILSDLRVEAPGTAFFGTDANALNGARPDVIILIGDWALVKLGLKGKIGPMWWDGKGWVAKKPESPVLSVMCVPSITDLVTYPFWFRAHGAASLGIPVGVTNSLVQAASKFGEPNA